MAKRVLCVFHKESTPSLIVYKDYYHCFGCGAHGPNTAAISGLQSLEELPEAYIEDIQATMDYIHSLDKKLIRGLMLPYDEEGYYITWVGANYYKFRFHADTKSKYRCPSGIRKPIFRANWTGSSTLVIVEGEINAMSFARVSRGADFASPGGCNDFNSNATKKWLHNIPKTINNIIVVADNDAPGAIGAIKLVGYIKANLHVRATIHLMEKDANDILTEDGEQALAKETSLVLSK